MKLSAYKFEALSIKHLTALAVAEGRGAGITDPKGPLAKALASAEKRGA